MSELIKSYNGKPLFALLVVFGIAGGFWWTYSSDLHASDPGQNVQVAERPMYYDMSPLVVNITSGTGRNRYLKIRPALEVRQMSHYDQIAELDPLIRNSLLGLYSQTSPRNLLGDEGFENLRQQSLDNLQAMLENETGHKMISGVLFTEYVIQ